MGAGFLLRIVVIGEMFWEREVPNGHTDIICAIFRVEFRRISGVIFAVAGFFFQFLCFFVWRFFLSFFAFFRYHCIQKFEYGVRIRVRRNGEYFYEEM